MTILHNFTEKVGVYLRNFDATCQICRVVDDFLQISSTAVQNFISNIKRKLYQKSNKKSRIHKNPTQKTIILKIQSSHPTQQTAF